MVAPRSAILDNPMLQSQMLQSEGNRGLGSALAGMLYPQGWRGGVFGVGRPVDDWFAQQGGAEKTESDPNRAAMSWAMGNPLTGAFGAADMGGMAGMVKPVSGALDQLASKWASRGVKNFMFEKDGKIFLNKVVVPKESRGQGVGSQFMRELAQYADDTGQTIALSPSKDFGASSVDRLIKFYKRFGLVENKGPKRDFSISESMIRKPKAGDR